ncbi:hypothetical protein [Paraclostridium sordellii]|uniref:hypothetical protein n=1 Tax=Paraclostridium sordellii TaxID=1505 RepID=UPI0018978D8A|nr:hypothetical protein [Paeniclostridium sordellii]
MNTRKWIKNIEIYICREVFLKCTDNGCLRTFNESEYFLRDIRKMEVSWLLLILVMDVSKMRAL